MLTQHDIDMMSNTVMDILESWGTTAKILVPKPEDEQPNWNPLMREYTGDIEYNILEDVPCERLEVVNEYYIDNGKIKAGKKIESGIQYKFPAVFNNKPLNIVPDMIFIFSDNDNEKYRVDTIRKRIGETIVDVELITGGTDSGW